jgi:ankyrin repeat protein
VVKLLLKELVFKNNLDCEVTLGLWPIHLAAQMRAASTFKLLVDCDVDITREDPKRYTPFMFAVDWGNAEVVQYFLEERRIQDEKDRPEHVFKAVVLAASHWKRVRILLYIVEKVPEVLDMTDEEGRLLVDLAVDANNMRAAIGLSFVMIQGQGAVRGASG